jgi:hypothetical protein
MYLYIVGYTNMDEITELIENIWLVLVVYRQFLVSSQVVLLKILRTPG